MTITLCGHVTSPSPVAQRLPEPDLPGDGGEVRHDAGVVLHQDLAVHDAPGGGAVPVLGIINKDICLLI